MTKTQIDRLGERIKHGEVSEDDLRALDSYRKSFGNAYESVIETIRSRLRLEPTGRPAKSTSSVVEKLRRESIRLSQMQDIAGCRVVVSDTVAQDAAVAQLRTELAHTTVSDRREKPSHGYKAVHIIVAVYGKSVEIQVRTLLQHVWAELSEKLSDVVDPSIKYGGGSDSVRHMLANMSEVIARTEALEPQIANSTDEKRQAELNSIKETFSTDLQRIISRIAKLKQA